MELSADRAYSEAIDRPAAQQPKVHSWTDRRDHPRSARARALCAFSANSWTAIEIPRPVLTSRRCWLRRPAITDIENAQLRGRFDLDALRRAAITCRGTAAVGSPD